MFARFILWLLDLLRVEKHEIGRTGLDRYLTRWILFGRRDENGVKRFGPGGKLFLHWFHRSDAEPYFHDHPFAFWSLILWGGYWEHTEELSPVKLSTSISVAIPQPQRRWYGPLSLLRRPATWRHRVELPAGRKCWTLVWTSPKSRTWGFWCAKGFVHWKQHMANEAAGKPGCGE